MAKLIWDYVREACIQCNITGPGDSLEYTPAHTEGRPVIHADDSNRVLLFPGAFNPPHQGHVQLLKSVLSDVTRHLNIRGVIIFPQDDEQVREKTKHEPVDLDLTKSKRSALWRSAEEFPEKDAWVFEGSRSSLRKLQNQLQRNLKGEHINLTYLLLVGPDWLSTRAVYDPGKWNCDEAITSDISRPVDFRCDTSDRGRQSLVDFDVQLAISPVLSGAVLASVLAGYMSSELDADSSENIQCLHRTAARG
ncbi:Rossmann-like alpha/beta/alpha sandwich fold protein [Metarhizium rileyi]|uniref:Rossmann-like alpha/beta/alpha sandwich fold protein n=1 Tax=Metarhizium rileyi (strain RCEF 4871) TaxID=1649241 RepID=A0A162LT65_METRR|nr:Rossmann-like alpha/beta/alpha sandwich fold protein [Metarhizium rileyi RCEF 4871]